MPIVFIYNKMTVEEVAELRRSVRDILSRLETVDRESSYGIYFALLL